MWKCCTASGYNISRMMSTTTHNNTQQLGAFTERSAAEHLSCTSWDQVSRASSELAASPTSGLTSILIPGPQVVCGGDHDQSDEGREEVEEGVSAVVVLELLAGHSAAALGPSPPLRFPPQAQCVRLGTVSEQLAVSFDRRCTWFTPAQ